MLLTLDVPNEQILLSDFDMWHVVLNDGYLPLCSKDDRETFTQEEKIASWENVFCWDNITDYWKSPKTTQATLWEIWPEWVKKAEHFISG